MRVFVAVADDAGFAAAARRLGMSAPAVTRAVASLEDELGVKLIKRTTRHLRVTEAGFRYLHDARRILDEVSAADEAAAGLDASPRGRLAITAPVMFGRMFVLPGVVDYLRRYPQMQVDTLFLDRVVSLLEEGLDVGIRIGEIPDSSMRAIKVGQVRMLLVAAPDYLDQHGNPGSPEELSQHCLIASRAGNFSSHWRLGHRGDERHIRITPRLTTTTNDAAISAATQGLGITRAISYQVGAELAAGALQPVLTSYTPAPLPIHIVHRDDRNPPAKVRAFIDLLAQRLKSDPALQ
ncbi:LysR family transcriptional regulator [Motiliproteus coralliicola]|uniref:LysR family transcriptional regulator n=2 Tax=Motiliproteus coralliicola TaxID=2283196 RepID=A0A369WXR2_9GAMM|nr:LysR family transcriptional regulator [Motiliproteus coralliicola]